MSYLPLSHIAAQMMDIWLPIKVGGVTYFAQTDALKVGATWLSHVSQRLEMGRRLFWVYMF